MAPFDRFWAAYPRRPDNPKVPARKIFDKAIASGDDPEVIIAGAVAFAGYCAQSAKPAEFIPYARTWLGQRRWEDFEEAPASADPQPSPEPPAAHPLTWLLAEMEEPTWVSWIKPLTVSVDGETTVITALTQLAAQRVERSWGRHLKDHFGAVRWAIAPRSRS